MRLMGYKNMERVYPLARAGKLAIYRDGVPRLDDRLLTVLTYMALNAKSKEDYKPGKTERSQRPYWCYWGGDAEIVRKTGMMFSPELVDGAEDRDVTEQRQTKTLKRVSSLNVILENRGVIKKIVRSSNFTGTTNVWLLMLGTPEENAEAESIAREYYESRGIRTIKGDS